MRRQRSAKKLGTRHDLHYFKRWTNWRKLRTALAVTVPIAAVVWIVGQQMSGGDHPASSGPLSRAHSFFSNDCSACHAKIVAGFRISSFQQHTSDEACLTCHAAPAHKSNQTFTPECSSCHVEHKGAMKLAQVAERNCTQCHADLKTRNGKLQIAPHIRSFNSDHPEFAALRVKESDPGTIAFNHAVHLKGVEGPGGKRVELDCADCHRTGSEQAMPWRFAAASFKPVVTTEHAYMAPPTYEKNCAGCHDLRFDANVAENAPHDRPEVVYAFLQKIYSGPAKRPQSLKPARLIPSGAHNDAHTPTEHIAVATRILWAKTCKECHQLDFGADGNAPLPAIVPSQITGVWLSKASFNHAPHRAVACESCHDQTVASQQTSDVLVPGIAICQTCHNGDPKQVGHSENRCFECHGYHDWKQQPAFKGKYNLDQLKRTRRN